MADSYSISLHEIVIGPPPQLHLLVKLPSPGLCSERKQHHQGVITSAKWANDGSAVLLCLCMEVFGPPSPGEESVQGDISWDPEGTQFQVGQTIVLMLTLPMLDLQSLSRLTVALTQLSRPHMLCVFAYIHVGTLKANAELSQLCSDKWPIVQELYMLDTRNYALLRVAQSTDFSLESLSSASNLFLALWKPASDRWSCSDQYFEVYSCSGQRLCSFWDPEAFFDPPIAHLPGNQAAIAHATTFSLWDLEAGQNLGTAGPGHEIEMDDFSRSGLIAASSAGSRLAFCPPQSSTLFIYTAVSLEALGTLMPGDGCTSEILALGCQDQVAGAIWGVYGLLLHHNVYVPDIGDTTRSMEFLQIHEECSRYDAASLGGTDDWVHEELATCSCSPCGSYLCRFVKHVPQIQVHDLRSGQIVVTHMVGPAVEGKGEDNTYYDAAMHWSSCGRRLMIVLCIDLCRHPRLCREHLTVLQFY